MSSSINLGNGKWQTVADLENAAIELENNLEDVNKEFIRSVLIGLNNLMNSITHLETGVFTVVLKWFRLYSNVYTSINPDNTKLLKYFENSVPTVLTYIIGCLQYKTKEIPDYHYKLLDILEQILENMPTKVLVKIKNFEIGTIGCLWNPIDIVGDFNTQLKSLKVLSILLKQFDDERQNEELKHIKWANLNCFQDKLKTIIRETKLSQDLENTARDLLNNFNMNLSKSVLVYSFHCKSMMLGNKYEFYKPLNFQKFWIDVNYTPKTLTYMGRFKLSSEKRYENISVVLKIETMKLDNSILCITFKEPGKFSKHFEHLTHLPENVIKCYLPEEEEQRLKENNYIIDYFNDPQSKIKKINQMYDNVFDSLRNENTQVLKDDSLIVSNSNNMSKMSSKDDNKGTNLDQKSNANRSQKFYKHLFDSPRNQNTLFNDNNCLKNKYSAPLLNSPKTSKKTKNKIEEHPTRKLRERKKMFTTLLDEDWEPEIVKRKGRNKKSQNRKPRESKPRRKQVCKVTPTVELINVKQNEMQTKSSVKHKVNDLIISVPKCSSPLITTQDCNEILKNVADVYNVGDTTYAKPCQSYRKFKTDFISNSNLNTSSISSKRDHQINSDNANENFTLTAKRHPKVLNTNKEENKENINPSSSKPNLNKNHTSHIKRSISTDLFESQHKDIIPPNKILEKPIIENKINMAIDLTCDEENISNTSFECEEVCRNYEKFIENTIPTGSPPINNGIRNLCTPRPTSAMNVSDLNDSDMELTQIPFNYKFITSSGGYSKDIHYENKEKNANRVKQISPVKDNSLLQIHSYNEELVCSSDEKQIANNKGRKLNCPSKLAETIEMPIKTDFIVMHSKPFYYCQQNATWRTPDKNDMISTSMETKSTSKCQITPTAVIMHQIEVSTRRSLIFRNNKPKNCYSRFKAKKNLNCLYSENQHMEQQPISLKDKLMLGSIHSDTMPLTINKDGNNNIILSPLYNFNKTDNFRDHQNLENTLGLALKHLNQQPVPFTMQNYTIDFTNDNTTQNLTNENESSSATETTQIPYNKEIENDHCNGYDSTILGETNESSASRFTVDELLINNLQELVNNHNKNIKMYLENAHHRIQTNISNIYSNKFTELLKAIYQKSERQKYELEKLVTNIGHLVIKIQTEYETFIKRTKEYDINRDIIKHILESLSNTQNTRSKEYEDLMKELNNESSGLFKKLLNMYLKK